MKLSASDKFKPYLATNEDFGWYKLPCSTVWNHNVKTIRLAKIDGTLVYSAIQINVISLAVILPFPIID